MPPLLRIFALHALFWLRGVAQPATISTNMPVPPMQWLNIQPSGSSPPPLKDSAIGYDENTRTLIIFGGESQAGLPQQGTYLLNLDSLQWSTPQSKVPSQMSTPPARSRALGTGDFAANSRRDFVIFGGKGSEDIALNDVWAFDYLNQFWVNLNPSSSTRPKPRWGAVGGIDQSVIPGSANNVNTTFYIAGGSDSTQTFPPSDIWKLVITGTLASDVNNIQGQWQDAPIAPPLPGKSEAGGTLISKNQALGARIVISGGCASNVNPLQSNSTCSDPATYVLTVGGSSISPSPCPAPRIGPVIVPNLNPSSSSFTSQAFMLLGTFDSSQWNDDGGLSKGEVAVLDADAGTWARVLPATDPNSSKGAVPTPRQGSAALSFPSALVGSNRQAASDTIIFGGQDSQGNYLNDLWILRSYDGSITSTGDHWPGFGDGNLQSGISATGAGVTVQYLTQCAQQVTGNNSSSSSAPTNQPAPTAPPGSAHSTPLFDVSIVHRTLSPVSIALALAATLVARLSSPAVAEALSDRRLGFVYIALPVGVIAYAIGVAGFVTSFTSTTRSTSVLHRRAGGAVDTFLKTGHAQAGFVLFLCLYGLVPTFAAYRWLAGRRGRAPTVGDEPAQRESEEENGEKETPVLRRAVSPAPSAPEVHSTPSFMSRQRAQSGPGLFPGWKGREISDVSESGSAIAPTKSFEVVNRPQRGSGGIGIYHPREFPRTPADIARSLGDMSWLEKRRSVGVVGELDYALSQLPHASPRSSSPPITSRPPTVTMSNRPFVRTPTPQPISSTRLDSWDIVLHTLFHLCLLANCVLALIALFSRAPRATFIVFLIWTLGFYVCLLVLAWNGRPQKSILTTLLTPLRTSKPVGPPPDQELGSTIEELSNLHSPPPGGSPYIYHQPPWRRAVSPEEEVATRMSQGGRHTFEADDDPDQDMDDDEGQRHMEEELMRRDVNIVTIPRRKLWITNPS